LKEENLYLWNCFN